MGEFKVHRVRFFDYMPSAIRTVTFNSRTERLAVARTDGAVEIFHFADRYFQEKVRMSLETKQVMSVRPTGIIFWLYLTARFRFKNSIIKSDL